MISFILYFIIVGLIVYVITTTNKLINYINEKEYVNKVLDYFQQKRLSKRKLKKCVKILEGVR